MFKFNQETKTWGEEKDVVTLENAKYAIRHLHSDSHCYEIVERHNEKCISIRKMKQEISNQKEISDTAKIGGFFAHFDNQVQKWQFESDLNYPIEKIRLHKDKRWHNKNNGVFMLSIEPFAFYDHNF